jgi:hypothetical protein
VVSSSEKQLIFATSCRTKQKSLNALLTEVIQNYLNSEEDEEDLALIEARETEPCSSLEDVVMRLKANGKI